MNTFLLFVSNLQLDFIPGFFEFIFPCPSVDSVAIKNSCFHNLDIMNQHSKQLCEFFLSLHFRVLPWHKESTALSQSGLKQSL